MSHKGQLLHLEAMTLVYDAAKKVTTGSDSGTTEEVIEMTLPVPASFLTAVSHEIGQEA